MTAPIWIAAPPEVHSALLSTGPGPAALVAAAGAWNTLSAEYASVAEELGAVLAAVQAGAWEGPSAESYAAAHVPYLAWLTQASAKSAATAAQHETAAAAYTAALAAMPTLAELATNHIVHGVLVATNFFGLNTIPIALNEADYLRMWIQAATTMAIYQAISGAAVASTPQTTPSPVVVNPVTTWTTSVVSAVQTAEQVAQDASMLNPVDLASSFLNLIQNFSLAAFLQDPIGYTQLLVESFVGKSPLLSDLYFGFGGDHVFEFAENPVGFVENIVNKFLADPVTALSNPFLLVLSPDDFASIGYSVLSPFFIPAGLAVAPVGALGGLAALPSGTELADLPQVAAAPVPAPVVTPHAALPVAGMAPTTVASAVAPGAAPAPAPAPTTSTIASAPPAPAASGVGFAPPYAVGPPGIGFDSGLSSSASAKSRAPQADSASAAAVAAAAAREQARARRRRRAKQRGYSDEFADMNVEVNPDWTAPGEGAAAAASDRGAGSLGFAGTVSKDGAQAGGFTTLSGDGFGGGPKIPMLPNTWDPEAHDQRDDG